MKGKYSIVITKRARKDIDKLDFLARKRLGKALKKLENNPLSLSTRLIDHKLGSYRYRVGDHRVIFDMDGQNIVILRVGHRREIYR
jgi:mRNA interferase RelE/StbE